MDPVRRWRVWGFVPFPQRQVALEGNWPLPERIGWVTRIPTEQRTLDEAIVAIRPVDTADPAYAHVLSGFGPGWDVAELAWLVEGESPDAVWSRIDLLVELVIEDLSFQLHSALAYLQIQYLDVTPPVAVGDVREITTQAGAPIDKFLRDLPMGGVQVPDTPTLAAAYPAPDPRLRQALGWYIKALSTPYVADQFIFLWIALDLFRGMSGIGVTTHYRGRCGHTIATCPECAEPLEREVQGESVKRYLTSRFGIEEQTATQLWKARQIMHGAVPFDSQVMRKLGELVQVVRAVIAVELKAHRGLTSKDLPVVQMGVASINPVFTGLDGMAEVSEDDLAWPARSET